MLNIVQKIILEQIKKLPVDFDTWKQMNYDPLYYVATSAIRFYENRLEQLDNTLTEQNKEILRESIVKIEKLIIK